MSAGVIISTARSLINNSSVVQGVNSGYQGFVMGSRKFNVDFPAAAIKNFKQEYSFSIPLDKTLFESNFSIVELNKIIKQRLQGLDLVVDNFTIILHPDKKILEFEPTTEFAREMAVTPGLMNDIKLKLVTIGGPAVIYGGAGALAAHVTSKLTDKFFKSDDVMPNKVASLVKEEIEKRAMQEELHTFTRNVDLNNIKEQFI